MTEHSRPPPGADLGAIDDPSIPVLTERIYLPAVELDTALPASLLPPQSADEDRGAPDHAAVEQVTTAVPAAPPAQFGGAVDVLGDPAIVAAPAASETPPRLETADEVAVSAEPLGAIEAAPAGGPWQSSPLEPAVTEPPASTEATATVEAAQQATSQAGQTDHERPAAAPTATAVDLEAPRSALEAQADALRAAVLQRMSARLPEQVAAAVRDLLQPAIDQAMARLGEEAQVALRITLQDLVNQALRDELARGSGTEPQR